MPTVLSMHSLRVVVYPNDHRPAHVHVMGGGCEAVFVLDCSDGPPVLRENYGYSRRMLTIIGATLADNLMDLCLKWSALHGCD